MLNKFQKKWVGAVASLAALTIAVSGCTRPATDNSAESGGLVRIAVGLYPS